MEVEVNLDLRQGRGESGDFVTVCLSLIKSFLAERQVDYSKVI